MSISSPQKIHRWDVKSYEEDGVLKDWVEEADHIAVIVLYNGLLEQLEAVQHERSLAGTRIRELEETLRTGGLLREELQEQNESLRRTITRMAGAAGHPDPAEGCRVIIGLAREALSNPASTPDALKDSADA